MDEESYEKSLIMYVVIGEPRQIAGKLKLASTDIANMIWIVLY